MYAQIDTFFEKSVKNEGKSMKLVKGKGLRSLLIKLHEGAKRGGGTKKWIILMS